MPKFIVTGHVTISVNTDVEAKSAAEAKRIAAGRGLMTFCHQCATGEPHLEWVTSGELDGEVRITGTESAS
jgi:hypothetical protein